MTPKIALMRPLAILAVVIAALLLAGAQARRAAADPPSASIGPSSSGTAATTRVPPASMNDSPAETTGTDSAEFLPARRARLVPGRQAGGSRPRARDAATQRSRSSRPSNRNCCASSRRPRRDAATKPGATSAPCRRRTARSPPRSTTKPASRWPSPPATSSTASAPNSRANASSPLAKRNRARTELLGQLRAAADRGVALAPPPGSDAIVRGWLEAAGVAADNLRNPTLGTTRLAAFRSRYPSHPALGALAGEPGLIVDLPPESKLENAPHVALMLPLSGRTAAASAQIRDGFMTAYYQLPANARPRLRVYDTAATSIAETIAAASGAGAEFIVGPLTREEVIASAELLTYTPADPRAQFPAAGPAGSRAVLPVRAVARRRCPRGRALHRRHGQAPRRGASHPKVTGARASPRLSTKSCAPPAATCSGQASFNAAERDYRASIMQVLRTDDSAARHSAHPGRHRPEARVRAAPPTRHPVHLRAEPAWRGAAAAAAAALPSRRRHPHLYARRRLRTASHREPGNRRRHVSGHAVDARRRGTIRGSARGGARLSTSPPRAAAGCSRSATTPTASPCRCSGARPSARRASRAR